MNPDVRANMRLAGWLAATLVLLTACDDDPVSPVSTPPSVVSSTVVAAPIVAPAPSAHPPMPTVRVLARGEVDVELVGSGRQGVALWGATVLRITAGTLVENPVATKGLENPKWQGRVLETAGDAVAFVATRDPEDLMKGDELVYGDSKKIDATRCVFRALDPTRGWLQTHACGDSERAAGLGGYDGRLVALVANDTAGTYRVRLIAGPTGFAPPEPAAAPSNANTKPTAAVPSAAPSSSPPSPSSAAPIESAAPDASADAGDPPDVPAETEPTPVAEHCKMRLTPFGFDGGVGHAITVGKGCGGEAWWSEHWSAEKGASTFSPLPALPHERVIVAFVGPKEAYLAVRDTRTLLRWSGDNWESLNAPGTGSVSFVASSPTGRLWIIAGGRVFHRTGDAAFRELRLPDGETATSLIPADEPLTFVAAGHDLIGPKEAAPDAIVEVAPGKATALCTEPYVIVVAKVARRDVKALSGDVDRVDAAGLDSAQLVFGHRGLEGVDALQAKMTSMADATKLSTHLGGAAIVCGAPRNEKAVD